MSENNENTSSSREESSESNENASSSDEESHRLPEDELKAIEEMDNEFPKFIEGCKANSLKVCWI